MNTEATTPIENAFRACTRAIGSSAAREIVKRVGGADFLPDVPANKVDAVIAAFDAATAGGGIARASAPRRNTPAADRAAKARSAARGFGDKGPGPLVERAEPMKTASGGIDADAIYRKWNRPAAPAGDD